MAYWKPIVAIAHAVALAWVRKHMGWPLGFAVVSGAGPAATLYWYAGYDDNFKIFLVGIVGAVAAFPVVYFVRILVGMLVVPARLHRAKELALEKQEAAQKSTSEILRERQVRQQQKIDSYESALLAGKEIYDRDVKNEDDLAKWLEDESSWRTQVHDMYLKFEGHSAAHFFSSSPSLYISSPFTKNGFNPEHRLRLSVLGDKIPYVEKDLNRARDGH